MRIAFARGMSERIDCLVKRAARFEHEPETARRRQELVSRAVTAGHPREYADQLYDVAEEEGVDPAVAFELVLCGVGVLELIEPRDDQWEEAQIEAPPPWVNDEPPTPDSAARERHARISFRRLRSILEETPSPEQALLRFAREPDVGDVDF